MNAFLTNISGIAMAWDINSLFKNAKNAAMTIGGSLLALIGVIMVIVAAVQIAKGLMSQGRSQTNWLFVVLLFIFGGAFLTGGITLLVNIASGSSKTIENLGNGGATIIATKNFLQSFIGR
jgi:hypothetical protein